MRERARVASVSLPHAGDWLVVAPLVALGLHLRPQEFVLAVKYRLGLAVFDQAGPCPACLKQSDVLGDHAMCCGTGGERIARHNHLRDAIFDTAAAAGLGPVKEGRFLLPGCDRRPADVLLHNWAQGRDAALDVTVVTPMRQDLVEEAASTPGHVLVLTLKLVSARRSQSRSQARARLSLPQRNDSAKILSRQFHLGITSQSFIPVGP